MARPTALRHRLQRDLVVTVALLGGALLATTFVVNRRTVETLSASLIHRTAGQAEVRMRSFFEPVVAQLRLLAAWRAQGALDFDDPGALNGLLASVLGAHPQISSLMIADGGGREHMLLSSDGRWRNRQMNPDAWGRVARWVEWSDTDPQPEMREENLAYDPRERPWFRGAVEQLGASEPGQLGELHWTMPYMFFTTKDPGITVSIAFRDASGVDQVVGFDVLLNDISVFTAGPELQPSENGLVVVVEDETSEVLGLPRDARFADEAARRRALLEPVEMLGVAPLTDAAAARRAGPARGIAPIRFRSGGHPWWVGVRRLDLGGGRALRIGVLVPESDLLGGLLPLRLSILGVTLLVMFAAIWRARALARGVSEPIEALVGESERIRKGDLEGGAGIASDLREVRALADAQQRMREGLRSLMKLERDLQVARQIQQNTFPSVLPGLPGFDFAAWSEPAEETGGDTYDLIGLRGDSRDALLVTRDESADRVVMLLADATGHGIGPALSVTQLRAMLRMALRMGGDLEAIARHLNHQLCDDLPPSRFITTWLGMLDPVSHSLQTFSGGQAPLLHYRAARDDFEVRQADAPPFGILSDMAVEIAEPVALAPGDVYAVFSDGIFEARDPDDEQFGEERVCAVLRDHRADAADAMLDAVRAAVEAFVRGRPADDDQTAIIIKRRR